MLLLPARARGAACRRALWLQVVLEAYTSILGVDKSALARPLALCKPSPLPRAAATCVAAARPPAALAHGLLAPRVRTNPADAGTVL